MYNKKESTEDYLEAILIAQNNGQSIRAVDLSRLMNFSKPSVSVALKKLKNEKYVEINESTGEIILTDTGRKIAENTLERHTILKKAFMTLGVNEETASEDACKVEHLISEETFLAIKKYLDK